MDRLSISPMVITLVLTLTTGCHRGVSGGYMAKFTNGVDWLQLVKTPDNHLTGQFVELTMQADGKIDQKNGTFTGAIDGETIILLITGIFGMQSGTLSGNLNGNKLTLTGPVSSPAVLNRADFDEYQREVKALNGEAQRIISQKAADQRAVQAQENFMAETSRVLQLMQEFDSKADVHLSKFPGAEEGLHAITAKMAEYVNRERQLDGDIARSQLGAVWNEGSLAMDQLHDSIQSLQQTLGSVVQPIAVEAANLQQTCRNVPAITREQWEGDKAACDRLAGVDGPFRVKLNAMTGGLAHLQDVYKQEREVQRGLLQAAGRLR